VISVTHLISILIGFHLHLYKRQRVVMTILNVKAIEVLSIIRHSFCEVTDSMSTNYKNDIWTEITNPW